MHHILHTPVLNYAGLGVALVAVGAETFAGAEWTGIGLHLALIAGVGVANYRLQDILKRVERLEGHIMGHEDGSHSRSQHRKEHR